MVFHWVHLFPRSGCGRDDGRSDLVLLRCRGHGNVFQGFTNYLAWGSPFREHWSNWLYVPDFVGWMPRGLRTHGHGQWREKSHTRTGPCSVPWPVGRTYRRLRSGGSAWCSSLRAGFHDQKQNEVVPSSGLLFLELNRLKYAGRVASLMRSRPVKLGERRVWR